VNLSEGDCCKSPRLWGSTEYLLWWFKEQAHSVPLVTTGNSTDLPAPGILGLPSTRTLLDTGRMDPGSLSGGRVTIGAWFNDDHTLGVEASGFLTETARFRFSAASNGAGVPALGVPFTDSNPNLPAVLANLGLPATGGQNIEQIASPTQSGSDFASYTTRLWGLDSHLTANILRNDTLSINVLVGFRYADLQESLTNTMTTTPFGGNMVSFQGTGVTTPISATDNFRTRDQFYGGDLGAEADYRWGKFLLGLKGTVALGSTHEVVDVLGNTLLYNSSGQVIGAASGGILALPSNGGRSAHDAFAVIPEVELKLGYQVTRSVNVFVAYNFLYWSDVVQARDQVNSTVNSFQIPQDVNFHNSLSNTLGIATSPGTLLPGQPFAHSDFWAQGVSFGVEFRF
jgi:hypothetical protein